MSKYNADVGSPDEMQKPSEILENQLKDRKLNMAEKIAPHINIHKNKSVSFQKFTQGFNKLKSLITLNKK